MLALFAPSFIGRAFFTIIPCISGLFNILMENLQFVHNFCPILDGLYHLLEIFLSHFLMEFFRLWPKKHMVVPFSNGKKQNAEHGSAKTCSIFNSVPFSNGS